MEGPCCSCRRTADRECGAAAGLHGGGHGEQRGRRGCDPALAVLPAVRAQADGPRSPCRNCRLPSVVMARITSMPGQKRWPSLEHSSDIVHAAIVDIVHVAVVDCHQW